MAQATTFFDRQAAARRSSRRLVLLFGIAVLAVLVAVNLVVLFLLGGLSTEPGSGAPGPIILTTSLLVLAVIGGAVLVKQAQLRKGGSHVAEALGGARVTEDARDPQLRRLRNVVEEMAIAAGVPVPAVYVLEHEDGINAFAAGHSASDAAVAVTRGALDRLNRDELQGVIAHEFSHILNGDMRLNLQLMGWLFGLLVLAIVGQRLMRSASLSRDRNAGGAVMFGLALFALGYIGVFFGHLIKAAVSRQREYLADASAVQFTRQTQGLAGALKKIAAVPQGSRLHSADAEDVSHMLFAHGLRSRLFATHPPVLRRIAALEPGFDPTAFKQAARPLASRYDGRQLDADLPVAGLAESADRPAPSPAPSTSGPTSSATADIGRLDVAHVQLARQLRGSLPDALVNAAHTPSGALALLLALLLDETPAVRAAQRQALVEQLGEPAAATADGLRDAVARLQSRQRVPLAAMAMPALRRLPMMRLHALRATVAALIQADGRITLREYVLGAMLEGQLDDLAHPRRASARATRRLDELGDDAALLLALMAGHSHDTEAAAHHAYRAAIADVLPAAPDYTFPTDWALRLDGALQRLDALVETDKAALVDALLRSLQTGSRLDDDAFELLRITAARLHIPLPPRLT